MEVAGLISSSFALGRVKSIIAAAEYVLQRLGRPAGTLRNISERKLKEMFTGFRYRFFSADDLLRLLSGIGGVLRKFGTLENCFLEHFCTSDETSLPALAGFVKSIHHEAGGPVKMLPDPGLGSACKRLHLFLRWMVRRDAVDPGVWEGIGAGVLVVPMDVHMHRISMDLGMTKRKQADAKTALEVTGFFKTIRSEDPVRYDFCLTRMGLHPKLKSFDSAHRLIYRR
jgi:uncharacterized protein (TIGR02757 family)